MKVLYGAQIKTKEREKRTSKILLGTIQNDTPD